MTKIADLIKINKSTVSRILKKLNETGSVEHRGGNGRPKKLNEASKLLIQKELGKNPKISLRKLSATIAEQVGITVAPSTVKKELNEIGFFAYSPVKKPLLTKKNIDRRYELCDKFVKMLKKDVKRIIFSDESKFNLLYSDGKVKVWRERGAALKPINLEHTLKHNGLSVMVWACFSYEGIGNLEIIEGTMTGASYTDLLSRNLYESAEKMGLTSFIFQQDNDPKHTSKIAKQFIEVNDIEPLDWPAQSPDLNPIEHLWAHIKRQVGKRLPKNRTDLIAIIKEEWQKIDKETCQKYALSFKKRALAVYKANGNHVKY